MTEDKNDFYNYSLLTKVAWLYYIEEMTQKDIGEQLGLSRIKIIKMLEEARIKNIVQFKFSTFDRLKIEAEKKLIKKYNLKDVYIAPSFSNDDENNTLSLAAAMYIDDLIKDNTYISMGYGKTVSKVLNNLANLSEKDISIISLTGGVAPYLPNNQSKVFNAKLYLLPTPLFMSSKETAKNIRKELAVKEILDMATLSKLSVVGIGGMDDEATVLESHILNNNDFIKLKMQGAVGDILMHFIDSNGNLVQSEIEEKLVSTNLDDLKTHENVIGVAAGREKITAIKAALIGKYIHTLITDEETAQLLIKGENFDE
ncbi:sugar-binding transcriptional regulator [Vagococcus zengguangii]|uniref:sugar-binding transcriptional regulator n=1 Tax=Vagococcus zengguangii TaxID=2571750 RepID=UPI001109C1FB|nr:sugar-binding transcriptional regulator [Vagococcus zengguangii]TLG81019.1 sugar-binding transcriptional regulator [Vagococcus zengguangii]